MLFYTLLLKLDVTQKDSFTVSRPPRSARVTRTTPRIAPSSVLAATKARSIQIAHRSVVGSGRETVYWDRDVDVTWIWDGARCGGTPEGRKNEEERDGYDSEEEERWEKNTVEC